MTANATRRAVPMAQTGDGPRPDPTAFAPATRSDGERRADRRPVDESRADRRSTDGRRAASNRTADDDESTQ